MFAGKKTHLKNELTLYALVFDHQLQIQSQILLEWNQLPI